ncbi:DUF4097 family beta strand repeat-containing protein [Nocardia sp. NPDC020380]|uniref:DUF4097 family beta strand repeat-containing protein n=1 Tax=Nocardia sp. NPDC020380 TaxID=3364309 RepID=UPI0037B3727C
MTAFATPNPIALTVDVLSADVTVIASDRTDTIVHIRPGDAAKTADVRAAEHTQVDFGDNTLTVRTPKSWRTHAPFGGNPTIEVTIEVPTGSRLHATAGMGRVVGAGPLGDCELKVSAGDIVVEQPQGSVTAKTAKGNIRIGEAVRGVLQLQTSVGELEVGIHPGSIARLESNTPNGAVYNQLAAADSHSEDNIVHVYARNSFGNVIIGHATATR